MGEFRDGYILRRAQRIWAQRAEKFAQMPTERQQTVKSEAAKLLASLKAIPLQPEPAKEAVEAGVPVSEIAPAKSDWALRLPLLSSLVSPVGPGTPSGHILAEGTLLYHDGGDMAPIMIGQSGKSKSAPFPFTIATLGFTGSYLSIAFGIPDDVVESAALEHIFRLDWRIPSVPKSAVFARLNLRTGDGTHQILRELDLEHESYLQFSLSETETPIHSDIEAIWIDLLFGDPQQISVSFDDLVLSRRRMTVI